MYLLLCISLLSAPHYSQISADDDNEPAEVTPNRTLIKHSTPSSTTSNNNKRARTSWANKPQTINISTDILKEMLPNPSSPSEDAEMVDEKDGESNITPSRPAQQVYSTPSRREKKEEELAGPREGI
jgi:hypothetical protein